MHSEKQFSPGCTSVTTRVVSISVGAVQKRWMCHMERVTPVRAFPALPCRAIVYAVPTGLLAFGVSLPGTPVPGFCLCRPCGTPRVRRRPSRHSRAGLLFMPSLRDFLAFGVRAFPALPCRAFDYAVPAGLLALGVSLHGTPVPRFCLCRPSGTPRVRRESSRHSRAGLLIMPSLRDSSHSA
jgi:hypothetical protein